MAQLGVEPVAAGSRHRTPQAGPEPAAQAGGARNRKRKRLWVPEMGPRSSWGLPGRGQRHSSHPGHPPLTETAGSKTDSYRPGTVLQPSWSPHDPEGPRRPQGQREIQALHPAPRLPTEKGRHHPKSWAGVPRGQLGRMGMGSGRSTLSSQLCQTLGVVQQVTVNLCLSFRPTPQSTVWG